MLSVMFVPGFVVCVYFELSDCVIMTSTAAILGLPVSLGIMSCMGDHVPGGLER